MPKRQSNNPKRRIARTDETEPQFLERVAATAVYTGDPQHKSKPADYGFHPPADPRPNKSLCDGSRIIKLAEATALFREGIRRGMISTYCVDGLPKYVWAVDAYGHVYEAKLSKNSSNYHGYELGCNESAMKKIVSNEWHLR